ncbi:MAG: dihydrolipoyl dehydrogenase [Clostridia bacterium]|nr:dihydrolipoyl dehydrogenase [Clostridia bacterium]
MEFDVIVIGGGPGGYVAAIRAAQLGAKVAVVEKDSLGGTCLNRGCIPTKALVASAELVHQLKNAATFGINVDGFSVDFRRVMARKEEIVEGLVKGIAFLLSRHKIESISGFGKLVAPGTVEVHKEDGTVEQLTGKNIIIATGSEPALITALGYNGKTVITSNEALELEDIPKSLLIIGGGVIGCEFASIFNEFGTEVTIVEAMPNILPLVDNEISRRLTMVMKKKGIAIKTKAMISSVVEEEGGIKATLETGEEIRAEKALISIGRTFNTKGLGLENVGVALGAKGEILVDDYLRTNVPGIYAIGDVTNKIQLAHVASAQGLVAVENIMGGNRVMDYSVVPSCIFTMPEIGTVGITSQEAKARGINAKVGKFPFTALGKARCMEETDGNVKIITDAETDKVLGVHIFGPHATDLIAEAALAIQLGATAKEIAQTIHAHPTLAESMMEAAENVHGLSIHA